MPPLLILYLHDLDLVLHSASETSHMCPMHASRWTHPRLCSVLLPGLGSAVSMDSTCTAPVCPLGKLSCLLAKLLMPGLALLSVHKSEVLWRFEGHKDA